MNRSVLDESTRKLLLKTEVSGFLFVSVCAVMLHFLYEISGRALWAAVFSAVNESIWEHIKIFTLPYVLWAAAEICVVRIPFRRFLSAKVLSLYFLLLSIPVFYYTYTFILGENIAIVDILCGFVFTALAFLLSYKMIAYAPCIDRYFRLSVFLIALYYLMIGYFTFLPPKIELFRDPVTGTYGLPL